MVWSVYLPKKSLVGGKWWWQTKFSVSPGPGLWSFVLGPFGPFGPDLDLTLDLDLDPSLTIRIKCSGTFFGGHVRFVFTIVLFIFVLCVVTTITSFNEIPLDIITNPFKVIGNYLDPFKLLDLSTIVLIW